MASITNSLPATSPSLFTPVTDSSNTSTAANTTTSGEGPIFTGSSNFSSALQSAITRAVSIASLPIQQLTAEQTDYKDQATALTGLDTAFAGLQTALSGVQQAMSGSSYQATVSDPTLVSATLSDGAMEGNYSIEVDDAGAYATSMSAASWNSAPNASGQPSTYTLVIGTNQYKITPADNSATSVAAAINSQYGSQLQATVVNVGSNSSPDYRISLQSATLAPMTLDILAPTGASLQQPQQVGRPAEYIVNDSGNQVTSNSRTVDISDGVTLTLLASHPGKSVDVTVTRPTSALSDALSSFADAYNSARAALQDQQGQSGGALQGNPLVGQLANVLSSIATYISPGSSVSGLADLGLSLGVNGALTFNPATLMAADFGNSSGVAAFLGSSTSGGFLESAANALNSVESTPSGFLKLAESDVDAQVTSLGNQISQKQDQVNQLQTNLQSQMAAADTLIAGMEQQYSYLNSMFQAMQVSEQMYAGG
ncbi:MAG TPA: flagellar filament capping protein FliD [Bryobacteraceae bacterium]|nr:flagellar filament capping protein FliD [Bryobacteraceae bacterium]